jgi:large subunit ribosomal protein L21
MYAVIKTGGKQYKVAAGEKLKVEQIPADIGAEITLDQVLAVGEGESIKFGTPLVSGASVKATVVSHGRHDKVKIFKMRRRKHYQKRRPSSELHRTAHRRDQRLSASVKEQSMAHKKAAALRGTAATQSRNVWA